jgi:hypothetical protein
MMELQEATRKSFPVKVVQVTLQNIEEVAEWCKGTIEYVPTKMMGTTTPLPVVKIEGVGTERGKMFLATLGCWVVEFKGSFRSFKPAQFDSSFNILPPKEEEPKGDVVDQLMTSAREAEQTRQALLHGSEIAEKMGEVTGIYAHGADFKLVSGDDS